MINESNIVVFWSQTPTTRGLKNHTVQLLMIGHLEEAFDWLHYLPYIHSNFSRYSKTKIVLVFGGNNCIGIVHSRLLNEHSLHFQLQRCVSTNHVFISLIHALNQTFKSFMKCLYSLFHI